MHLTQQQQLNQMCPPPLGPPAAWFMNHHHPQPSGLPPPSATYHQQTTYHHQQQQNYYNNGTGSITPSNIHHNVSPTPSSSTMNTNNNNAPQQQNNHIQHQQQQHHHQPPQQQQAQQQQFHNYSYHHQPQLQQQQPTHQQIHNQQQYNQIHHQQQPLTIQQPQSQHVHHQHQQQQSPHMHHQQQQHQPQLSPHNTQPRPSPTLHQHQQPSPNYQQHSPLNTHLTSPSLQPSPVLHHQPPQQQQHSPLSRHQQQPTPPHHNTPTPTSSQQQHHGNLRPASVSKESTTVVTSHHPSNILQTEVRILELNRRLQCRPSICYKGNPLPNYDQYDDYSWWEEFMNDFFKDDATLVLFMQTDDKPVKYVLRRALISRFFRSYFDGGVTELSINLRNSKELRSHQMVVLECEHANIVTKNILKHPKVSSAPRVVVCTEGHLSIEFVSNSPDSLLIKSWKFKINLCREYIDRSITTIGLPNTLLVEPTTFQGLPNSTMLYLKMCSIMEPMQELMAQHKLTNLEPRACLKKLLFERFRFKGEDDKKVTVTTKRRKRKPSMSPAIGNNNATASMKRSKATTPSIGNTSVTSVSPPTIANLPPLNVMIVGEPSSMGSEYRDDNERTISKVENSNYVPPPPVINTSKTDSPEEQFALQEEEEQEKGETEKAVEEQQGEDIKPKLDIVKHDEVTVQLDLLEQSQQDVKTTELDEVDKQTVIVMAAAVEEESENPTEELPQSQQPQPPPPPPPQSVPRQISEEPMEKENNSFALIDETHMNSTATQSENHHNIMNSIPEDREDTCRSASCDSIVSKLPPSSNNKNTLTTNGSNNKQNRRRSSERKETLREGLMRTSDFVVAMKDLKCEHPALWRITTGNNLLQQFEPKTQNGIVLYENTNQYAGWNHEIRRDYVGVDVKLTQHTRNQITVERLLLNFQNLEDSDAFYDKHFVIYLQILISTALDPKFWESIENEPKHHDYFLTSRRIVEDITKRFKIKLSNKLKLSETSLKNVEKYPNLLIKPIDKDKKEQLCRACNTNISTQIVTFGNRSYDLHSYKPVKVTSELLSKTDDKDLNTLCEACLEIVKLYSEIHHMGWKLYNLAREKVEKQRTKGKPINAILDECLKDEDWLASIYAERDTLWSKVEHIQ